MLFEWDEDKNRLNQWKHGIDFKAAMLVFQDPYLLSKRDDRYDYGEERWQSVGLAENMLLSVAHTIEDDHDSTEEIIRIISARKAGSSQARGYYFNR